jgi:hypothetical protein
MCDTAAGDTNDGGNRERSREVELHQDPLKVE